MLTHRHSTSDAILSFLVIFAPAGFDTLDPGIGLVGSLHADLLLRESRVRVLQCGSYSVCLFSTFFVGMYNGTKSRSFFSLCKQPAVYGSSMLSILILGNQCPQEGFSIWLRSRRSTLTCGLGNHCSGCVTPELTSFLKSAWHADAESAVYFGVTKPEQ